MNTLYNWECKHSNIDINYEVAIQDNRLLIDDIIIEDELPAYYKPVIIKGNELVHEEYKEDVESVNEEMCEAQDDSKNTRTEQRKM